MAATKTGRAEAAGRTLFVNAHLVDPSTGLDETGDLLVEDGVIAASGVDLATPEGDVETVDCAGHLLCPGLIDMRVFTGEPGNEHRETLASASEAAAAGGVTTVICMPNTDPVIDDVALVDFLERRARDTAIVNVHPMAALTKGLKGLQMTEIALLSEAGAVAFTDAICSVMNSQVMRRALSYARDFDCLVVQHVEDPALAGSGVMNEGEVATRLGLSGIPTAAETIVLDRDIRLVELTGARYHAAQISCRASLEVIRAAKARGLPVTCGVSVNNLALNENDIGSYRTFFKVSPPLRSETDRMAMVEGVADGTIDVIVSGHDPQDVETKRHPFAEAAYGAVGLETLLAACLNLVHDGQVALPRLLAAMTAAPAGILGLEAGRLAVGAPADLILVDTGMPWVLRIDELKSKSKNTPFEDRRMQGRVLRTLVAGRTVYRLDRT
jgi:dihydroorotase